MKVFRVFRRKSETCQAEAEAKASTDDIRLAAETPDCKITTQIEPEAKDGNNRPEPIAACHAGYVRVRPEIYRQVVRPVGLLFSYWLAVFLVSSVVVPKVRGEYLSDQFLLISIAMLFGMPVICSVWFDGPDGTRKYCRIFFLLVSYLCLICLSPILIAWMASPLAVPADPRGMNVEVMLVAFIGVASFYAWHWLRPKPDAPIIEAITRDHLVKQSGPSQVLSAVSDLDTGEPADG